MGRRGALRLPAVRPQYGRYFFIIVVVGLLHDIVPLLIGDVYKEDIA